MKKVTLILFSFSLLLLQADSAFAQKDKKPEEVSNIGKIYHNVTGKFNGYFNAKEILKETVTSVSNEHQDNYNQILPLFRYNSTDTKSVEGKLDEAIKKASIDISLHRVSNWSDDCYFLIGQCQYLKKDYDAAEKTFEYLTAEYSPEAIQKREDKRKGKKTKKKPSKKEKEANVKKEEKPEGYFLQHRPIYEQGMVWLAKSYIERERYDDASLILTKMEKNPKTHQMFMDDIAEVRTYSYLKQKDYDNAVQPLENLLEISKKRSKKSRFAFILAQIHQQEGRGDAALTAFEQVLKYAPKYDMEFNTRLNIAQNSWITGKSNASSVIKTLDKMSKDVKNKEYKDQIFFALAKVYIKEKDFSNATKNLKLSIANNIDNKAQKAESYLQLASLFYDSEDFVQSSLYYDSTLQVLPTSDDRFETVRNRGTSLKDIAENILIINLQDSLIAISKMTDAEKRDLALQLKKASAEKEDSSTEKPSSTSLTFDTKQSSFFAYNPKTVKKGQKEFEKKWGARELTDNWRRSNKSSSSDITSTSSEVQDVSDSITDEEVADILSAVPDNPQELKQANQKIATAMFNLGTLYKDRLNHSEKSIATLTEYLSSYPDDKDELEALYYMYLLYKDVPNRAKADIYAKKITDKYPNSKYGKVLSDPNYLATLQKKDVELIEYYDKTYSLFKSENYQEAQNRIQKVNEIFGAENGMKAKFALLEAFCKGKLEGKDEYVKALKFVTVRYPNTEEEQKATEILRYLDVKTSSLELPTNKPTNNQKNGYNEELKATHYFLIAFEDANENVDAAKANIKSYHDNKYEKSRLRVSSIFLGDASNSNPMFVVRRFPNGEKAMEYYNDVSKNMPDYLGKKVKATLFPVSQNNYRQVLKQKNLDGYLEFFKEIYQK